MSSVPGVSINPVESAEDPNLTINNPVSQAAQERLKGAGEERRERRLQMEGTWSQIHTEEELTKALGEHKTILRQVKKVFQKRFPQRELPFEELKKATLEAYLVDQEQQERYQAIKAIEHQWRTFQTEEDLEGALGKEALERLRAVLKEANKDDKEISFEVLKNFSLVWRIRQLFLEGELQVFSHGQPLTMGLFGEWLRVISASCFEPVTSKGHAKVALRMPPEENMPSTIQEFFKRFPMIEEGEDRTVPAAVYQIIFIFFLLFAPLIILGTLLIELSTKHRDDQPKIREQLISVNTEFFNVSEHWSAISFWLKNYGRWQEGKKMEPLVKGTLAHTSLTNKQIKHVASLVTKRLQQDSAEINVGNFVLIALPKEKFEEKGYLALARGRVQFAPVGAVEQTLQQAQRVLPEIVNEPRAQARLLATQLHTPEVESWRWSPLAKDKLGELRRDLNWLGVYAAWMQEHPTEALLSLEEIPSKLSSDHAFLKKQLAKNGLFLKYLSQELRQNEELVQIAIEQNPKAEKYAIRSH